MAYHYDSNTNYGETLKTRKCLELATNYEKNHKLLIEQGLQPKLYILDNECPEVLKIFMNKVNEEFQLVPPHIHRRNASERANSIFKDHFIAGLVSANKDFPLHLWYRFVPHAIITLNLMRQSRINPKFSAHAVLHGEFITMLPH